MPTPEWSLVLAAHESWLKQVIRSRTGEPQAVEDVFQQLALIVCGRADSLHEVNQLVPWFHRIAVILSARHRRTMGRLKSKIEKAARESPKPPGLAGIDWLLNRERHSNTRVCIENLDPRDREILVLKYDEKMSYRELSKKLGITEKAVDRRLSRARAKLRNELSQFDIRGVEQ